MNIVPKAVCMMVGIFVIVLSRIIPHPPNATATGAIALFTARYGGAKYAVTTVVIAMVLSDIVIGFYAPMLMALVYGSFIFVTVLGLFIPMRHGVIMPMALSVIGSGIFFIITNFGVWAFSGMYPLTLAGLSAAYTLALPFYGYMLLGDMLYTGLIFGSATLLSTEAVKGYAVRYEAKSSS